MADYNTKKAQLLDMIENELREERRVRKDVLYYKAWKRFGFGQSIVDKALDNLVKVGRAVDNELGEVEYP